MVNRAVRIVERALPLPAIVHILTHILGTVFEAVGALDSGEISLLLACKPPPKTRTNWPHTNRSVPSVALVVALVGVAVGKGSFAASMTLLRVGMAVSLVRLESMSMRMGATPVFAHFHD